MIKAKYIKDGECFRKKNGTFGYIKISEAAAKFHELSTDRIYGVTSNGNITDVDPEKVVEKVLLKTFFEAHDQIESFNREFSKPNPNTEFEPFTLVNFCYKRWLELCDEGRKPCAAKDRFVYMGEVAQIPGRCVVAHTGTGKITSCYHTDDFIELTEDDL